MKINIKPRYRHSSLVIFFIIFTGILFNTRADAQVKPSDEYSVTLKSADNFFTAKDYANALTSYKKADQLKPGQKEVLNRIDQINTLLSANEKAKNTLFENAVLNAENFLKVKDYPSAKREYENALDIDPTAQYPKDRLAQIRSLYTDPNDISRYNEAMANGNQELTTSNFDKARNWFEIALAAKPDARTAKDKIAETDKLKAAAIIKKSQYDKLVTAADLLLKTEKRTEARVQYQSAADLIPSEPYAKQKIQEIVNWANAKKSLQDSYDKAIDQADQFYIGRDFANARVKYQEALKIKQEARYPKEMLDKTGQGEVRLQSVKERFDASIASADKFYQAGDTDSALLGYKSALAIIPGSEYPQSKITEIEKGITDRNSRKEAYDIALKNGDQSLGENKYDISLGFFRNALTLFPDEKYPKVKIDEINALLARNKSVENNYLKAIADGDARLKEKKYTESVTAYQQAITLKPAEKYPQDKIAEINKLLEGMKSQEENYTAAISHADQSLKELKYPEALTAYQEAAGIKPNEKYPKDKILTINGILSKQKAEQEKYDNALAAADKAYSDRNMKIALAQYQVASVIKPTEQYPLDKIAAINILLKDEKAREEMYQQAITTGDKLMTTKEYERALAAYQEAKSIKPDEKYPDRKITEINAALESIKSADQNYLKFISDGDAAFTEKKYTESIAAFQSALKIKPAETYPKDKITVINKLLADQKQLDDNYTKVIASADKAFTSKNYSEALTVYQQALSLKANEKYPQDKVTEINDLLADLKNKDEAFTAAVTRADLAFEEKKYADALGAFQEAAGIKAGEKYPKDKIAEINGILAAEKAKQDSYTAVIAKADKSFTDKQYTQAIADYNQASTINPAEQYPGTRIAEINGILADLKAKQESYDKAIADGDKLLADKKYEDAISAYNQALVAKPGEKYPGEKIAQINMIMNGIKANEENYSKAIAEADGALAGKKYTDAITAYKSALTLKPAEKYPQDKIAEIEGILADLNARDDSYSKAINEADEFFTAMKYNESIAAYQQAMTLKPGEKYPVEKIAEAQGILSDIKAKQAEYDKSVTEGDKELAAKKYNEALAAFQIASAAKPSEDYPKQKISTINTILAELKSKDDSFAKAVLDGDAFFTAQKYREAMEPYQRATTLKTEESYPKDQLVKINQFLAEQKKIEDQYGKLIGDADKLLNDKKYQTALTAFQEASALKPSEQYPKDKIISINGTLTDLQAKDQAYNKALAEGDAKLASGDLNPAIAAYTAASEIKPGETYPKEKIAAIQLQIKAIDDRYAKALATGDTKLKAKNYSDALNAYQQALEIKPGEQYPKDKIAQINDALLREKEELEKMYTAYIAEGDKQLAAQDYVNAKSAFVKASGIKTSEQYPKDKLIEINNVLLAQAKAAREEYDKAIVEADKLYAAKVLDQAIDAYEKAASLKPDETYPGEMVRKIKQYITDHSIKDINSTTVFIAAGDEKKFSFTSLEPRLKTNNYVMIRAKASANGTPKVYFNYGRDNAKNGGIVLRTISDKNGVDYIIRLAGQDKWYREDNNWVSIYTEGSGIEVSRIQVSQGE